MTPMFPFSDHPVGEPGRLSVWDFRRPRDEQERRAEAERALTAAAAVIEQQGPAIEPVELVHRASIPAWLIRERFGSPDGVVEALAERERVSLMTTLIVGPRDGRSLALLMGTTAVRFTGWVAQRPNIVQLLMARCGGPGGELVRLREDLLDRATALMVFVLGADTLTHREVRALAELLVATGGRFGAQILESAATEGAAWSFKVGAAEQRSVVLADRLIGLVVAAGEGAGVKVDPSARFEAG